MLKKLKKKDNLEYEFLPEAIEIIETPRAKGSAILLWSIFAFFVIAALWMYFAEVDMVSTARGKVIPDGRVKVIQPFEQGVIQAIYVTEGEKVKKGDTLVELDATLNDIEIRNLEDEINTLKLERDVLAGKDIGSDDQVKKALKENIIEANALSKEEYNIQKKAAEIEVSKNEAQLKAEKEALTRLKENLGLLVKKEEEYKKLVELGGNENTSLNKIKLNVDILQREANEYTDLYHEEAITRVQWQDKMDELNLAKKEYEVQKIKAHEETIQMEINLNNIKEEEEATKTKIEAQQANIEKLALAVKTSKLSLDMLENSKANTDVKTVLEKDKQIEQLEAQLNKSEKNQEYKTISAPVDGVIQGIATNTLGGVVSPAETIMTIVPDDTPLVIEAYLPNKDIGFVEVGQEVSIKVDTFPYQRYGVLKGKVRSISPDAIQDEVQGYIYRMQVEVEDPTINVDGKTMQLTSGMTVTAEIKTGKRKVLSFFLEPLVKYADEGINLR